MSDSPDRPESGEDSFRPASELGENLYAEMRGLAGRYFRRHRAGGVATLQPTALVHEAWLRLGDERRAEYRSRTHFQAAAAQAMHHVLIDWSRRRGRLRRGGDRLRVTLLDPQITTGGPEIDLFALEESLTNLAEHDPRAARVVELRYFGDLRDAEIAEQLGVSERTVRNDWTLARAWLRRALDPGNTGGATS